MNYMNSLEDATRPQGDEFLIPSQTFSIVPMEEPSNQMQFQGFAREEQVFEPLPFKPSSVPSIPRTKPRKNLSPYNLFFQEERKVLLAEFPVRKNRKPKKSHGRVGFQEMARIIASRWRQVDPWRLEELKRRAAVDKERYIREMKAYKKGTPVTQSIDPAVNALAKDLDRNDIDYLLSVLQ